MASILCACVLCVSLGSIFLCRGLPLSVDAEHFPGALHDFAVPVISSPTPAIFHALHSRHAQEKLLSDTTSRWELLAMLGLFGSCVSGLQALVLERSAWQQAIAWGPGAGAAFAAFALSLYTFYVLVPDVLVLGSSTILNLSLLTSDLWAAVVRLVMFHGVCVVC